MSNEYTPVFVVDGHDLTRYILYNSYADGRNDLDGPNAGRTLDGKMHRDYLGYKRKLEIKFRPLTNSEWQYIEHGVLRGNPWHNVYHDDFGIMATVRMYHSAFSGTVSTITGWRLGAAVNFIEE